MLRGLYRVGKHMVRVLVVTFCVAVYIEKQLSIHEGGMDHF